VELSTLISASAAGLVLTAAAMVLTPGPNMMYLVSRGISQGRRAGWISLMGTELGFVIYMTMANLGLAAVFKAVPWLYIGFKAAGALYLAFLAWKTLRPGGRGIFETQVLQHDSASKLFWTGLATNLLNPKAAVMYIALIPQFIDPSMGHVVEQGFALAIIHIAVSTMLNGLIIFGAGSVARALGKHPQSMVWQRRITGSLLGAVAVMLAREVPNRASA
jgi:threonine/homoserine/homoserine lactone efflux protein